MCVLGFQKFQLHPPFVEMVYSLVSPCSWYWISFSNYLWLYIINNFIVDNVKAGVFVSSSLAAFTDKTMEASFTKSSPAKTASNQSHLTTTKVCFLFFLCFHFQALLGMGCNHSLADLHEHLPSSWSAICHTHLP